MAKQELLCAEDIWTQLSRMKQEYERWSIVARKLGISRQQLFHCIKHQAISGKLLKAMELEVRYVRVVKA